jgi:hypothetical protein
MSNPTTDLTSIPHGPATKASLIRDPEFMWAYVEALRMELDAAEKHIEILTAQRDALEPSGNGKPPALYVLRNKFDQTDIRSYDVHSWDLILIPQQPETKEAKP